MSKIVIIGIIVLLAIGGGILLLAQGGTPAEHTSQGTERQLADLTLEDYQGNQVPLSGFIGKPLVVNAWAAWCPFCVKELPDFVSLQQEFPEIVVVAIDRAESLNTAKSYTDDLGITEDLVFLLDRSDSFYKSIGGFSMPETLFVDAEGNVQDHKRGPMDLQEMKTRLQTIL